MTICFLMMIFSFLEIRLTTCMTVSSYSSTDRSDSNIGYARNFSVEDVAGSPGWRIEINSRQQLRNIAACAPGMVLDGAKCINVSQCTKSVLSDGVCMDRCPEGYLFTDFDTSLMCGGTYSPCHYTIKDINQKPCVLRTTIVTRLVVLAVATFLYSLFILAFFSTRMFPVTNHMNCFKFFALKETKASDDEHLIDADGPID